MSGQNLSCNLTPTAAPPPAALVARWRDQGLRSDERIGWALERASRSRPDDEAVRDEQERCTLAELQARAEAISWQLLGAGVGAGDTVAFALPNTIDTVAVAAAIWRIGAVAAPIVTVYREREFSFILGQLRPAAVVTCADVRGRDLCDEVDTALAVAGAHRPVRLVSGGAHAGYWTPLARPDGGQPLPPDVVPADAEAPCLVLYTSGTTSEPKGVLHTSATLLAEVHSMQREWGLTFRDTMLMASPLTHITGLLQGLLVPCVTGARSVVMDRWDPDACVELIEREGATYMAGATPFLRGILEAYERRPDRGPVALRQYCCGGAAVPPPLIEQADALGIAAYRCWGMTELPTATLAGERDPLAQRAHTDGHRADGVEVEAVDEERRRLPVGREGELRVRGPERTVGYVDPALNSGTLDDDGWLYTGDVGVVDNAGYVRITGRLKDIVNRGGEKLSAREIEEVIEMHPAVREVAVVPLPDERLGEQVCAVVVTRDGRPAPADELRAFLRDQRIAIHKIPARVETLPALPRTAAGKVRKHELIERLTTGA